MQKGFGTLFIVIVLGSVALGMALWVSTSSLWSIRGSLDNKAGAQARALVNACAETALEVMRESRGFTGTGSSNINGSNCNYAVNNLGSNSRQIMVTASVGTIVRKVQIITSSFNPLTISKWEEVI